MHFCFPVSYVLAVLYLQSFVVTLALSLSLASPLNNLSYNATPGAVLNLLLLAEILRCINKLRETMDGLNKHHSRIVIYQKGQEDMHFTFYRIQRNFYNRYSLFLFFMFPSLFSFLISLLSFLFSTITPFTLKQCHCYEWINNCL